MKQKIGSCEAIEVFVDEFVGRAWVNIEKMGKIIKINPKLVAPLIKLLEKAKEETTEK